MEKSEIIKILTENNRLLREHNAMNIENEKLSNNSILQINANNQFIDKLKDVKLPEIKEFEVRKLIASVDRYSRPFNTMTIREIEDYLHLEIQSNINKKNILFQERIGHIEAILLLCERI
jgi:GMP synthase PP-ATPase subunit